jgi:hypothetical protein
MDKTVPPDKIILWDKRKCRKNTNMDCRIDIYNGGHRKTPNGPAGEPKTILQVLSVHLFEKTPIRQAFSDINIQSDGDDFPKHLNLFQ